MDHPDGIYIEHFTDGDLFDNTLDPGWEPLTASSLAQWGPECRRIPRRQTVTDAGARGGLGAARRQRLHPVEAGRDGEGRPVSDTPDP